MADYNLFIQKHISHLSTFKETSFDNRNKVYLCKDETIEVIDFDKVIEEKYLGSYQRPQSFDCIYLDKYSNHIYLIEFKNEKKPDKETIRGKLLDGKKELLLLLNELKISIKDYKFVFCLVYNKYIPKEERFKRGLYKSIRFEFLNEYKENKFIDDIYTEDVNFFTKQFKKNLQKDLMC